MYATRGTNEVKRYWMSFVDVVGAGDEVLVGIPEMFKLGGANCESLLRQLHCLTFDYFFTLVATKQNTYNREKRCRYKYSAANRSPITKVDMASSIDFLKAATSINVTFVTTRYV